jgi:hypothetical protein
MAHTRLPSLSPRRIVLGPTLLLVLVGAVAASAQAPALTTRFVSEQTSSPHPPDSLLAVGPSDLLDGTNGGALVLLQGRQAPEAGVVAAILAASRRTSVRPSREVLRRPARGLGPVAPALLDQHDGRNVRIVPRQVDGETRDVLCLSGAI